MLVLEHTFPFLLIMIGVLVAGAIGIRSLLQCKVSFDGKLGLLLLYLVLLAGMFWVLLLPGCRAFRTRDIKPRFIVMLDSSQSMEQVPPEADENRWERAMRALDMPWVDHVRGEAEIDLYHFDSQLYDRRGLGAAQSLSPTGTSTRIRDSLQQIERLTVGQEVAGILLVTDGHDTREASTAWASAQYRYPIYTVRLEDDVDREVIPDVAIRSVDTPQRVQQGRETEVRVVVTGEHTGGTPVVLQLFREDEMLDEQPVQIPSGGGGRELVFIVEHSEPGVFPFRLYVPPLEGEENVANNEYLYSVTVLDAENRLLYLEGVPRFEYRFLRRVLLADEQVVPAIFFTLADGSVSAGSPVEDVSADLDEETLDRLKIVVLGNLDAEELTAERAERIVDYVENGGSLVLLGGSRAWLEDGFLATPLRRVSPIDRLEAGIEESEDEGFPVSLTRAGQAHPVFSGEPEFWAVMPPVLSVYPHARLRAAAETLVVAETPQGEQDLVVVQRFGRGRVVAILTDSLWRWQMDPDIPHHPYARFWVQLLSWLLPDDDDEIETERIELFAGDEQLYRGESVTLTARVPESIRRDDIEPRLTITGPDDRSVPYTMSAGQIVLPDGRGLPGFTYTYRPSDSGSYRAVATYEGPEEDIESNDVIFHLLDYSPETIEEPIDEEVLRLLARSSGGRYFDDLESMNRALRNFVADAAQERLSQFYTLWQRWSVLFLIMAVICCTWFLRRRLQMP